MEGDAAAGRARSVHRAAGRRGAARTARVLAREICARRASRWNWLAEGKLKRAMELANKLGARYTLIVGDNEIAAGPYALKNMETGEQEKLTRDRDSQTRQCEQIDMESTYHWIFWASFAARTPAGSCAPPTRASARCSWAGCIAAATWAASSSFICATAKASRQLVFHDRRRSGRARQGRRCCARST